MINTNIIISTNGFQGFQNYTTASFSSSYAGGNILGGSFAGPIRASTALNNTNAVGIVEVQFSGLDAFTRLLPGFIVVNYPSNLSPSYQIEVLSYYAGGNLTCDVYISNQTGSTITVPAITFIYQADLYQAPF